MLPRGRNFGRTAQKVQKILRLNFRRIPRFNADTGPIFWALFPFLFPSEKRLWSRITLVAMTLLFLNWCYLNRRLSLNKEHDFHPLGGRRFFGAKISRKILMRVGNTVQPVWQKAEESDRQTGPDCPRQQLYNQVRCEWVSKRIFYIAIFRSFLFCEFLLGVCTVTRKGSLFIP